ncbi:hypothetical protein F2P56_017159 [Juglans regia]|uniref:Retrotransposon Copia-like N-terminal domain-containing protein n=1 Tax=Juglans regia TaxID=51240 RepID=A0A833XKR0_JUGRE|nr:hypothetical protein F2P56_017159 [Juglans regia]
MSDYSSVVASFITPPAITVTKLSRDNYHVWKAQLIPFFRGQGLFEYLDGTTTTPLKYVDFTNPESHVVFVVPNPLYENWLRQDVIILVVLFSTITETILIQVVSHTTSASVCQALKTSFSSQSQAHVIQLCTDLANARKGALSATDYFM